jgi:hypothetical protein
VVEVFKPLNIGFEMDRKELLPELSVIKVFGQPSCLYTFQCVNAPVSKSPKVHKLCISFPHTGYATVASQIPKPSSPNKISS